MNTPNVHDFISMPEGVPITRVVYMYNLLLAIRDAELPDQDIYYILENKHYTAWNDFCFFHVTKKRTLEIPALTEGAVRAEIDKGGIANPGRAIRTFVWERFRVSLSNDAELVNGIEDVIAFRSKEFLANTACLIQYFNIGLSVDQATKILQNTHSMPFSESELRARCQCGRFSNAVRLWFAGSDRVRSSRARIHDVENRSESSERITVLFSDMKDFARLVRVTHSVFTDMRALHEFRVLCKRYQTVICRAIRLHDGEILHTAGDAFVAVFRGVEAEQRAFDCARAMLADLGHLRDQAEFREFQDGFVTRIGLDTGRAQYGYLGPYELKERTAFGHCVNVASRLESAVKEHSPGGGILISKETASKISGEAVDLLREVSVEIKENASEAKCFLLSYEHESESSDRRED